MAEQETKQVTIIRSCNFTHEDGRVQKFEPGSYSLPASVADHWFIRAHTDDPPESEPPVGTPEYAMLQAKKAKRRELLDAAIAEQAEQQVRPQGKRGR